jgi:putative peptidoglycan lipid II flippase
VRFYDAVLRLGSSNVLVAAANLARDLAVAAALGATLITDGYFLAISIPIFLITVTTGAFRSAAVPLLETARTFSDAQFSQELRGAVRPQLVYGLAVGALFAAAAWAWLAFSPTAMLTTFQRELLTATILVVPMYFCTYVVELLQGPLQVLGWFLLPNLLRTLLPLGIAGAVFFFGADSIHEIAVFGTAGAALAMLALCLLTGYHGRLYLRHGASPQSKAAGTFWKSYFALIAATSVSCANPLVDQWIASLAGSGGASLLGYANRLIVGVAGLAGASLAPVLLVRYSRSLATGDTQSARALYMLFWRVMPWIAGTVAILVWLSSPTLIPLIYERGSFGEQETYALTTLVNVYAAQLPMYWACIAAYTLIWAISKNHIFIVIAIPLFVINAVLDIALLKIYGLYAMPVATLATYAISLLSMNWYLKQQLMSGTSWRDLGTTALSLALALAIGYIISSRQLAPTWSDPASWLPGLVIVAGFGSLTGVIAVRSLRAYRGDAQLARDLD